MENDMNKIRPILKELFDFQKFAALATHDGEKPYISLMAFAATNDLKYLVFATDRNTRKYANLKSNPHTAVLVDSRTNQGLDLQNAKAVTVTGRFIEAEMPQRARLRDLYLSKHPYMEEFVKSPSFEIIILEIESYYLVSKFQDVRPGHMR